MLEYFAWLSFQGPYFLSVTGPVEVVVPFLLLWGGTCSGKHAVESLGFICPSIPCLWTERYLTIFLKVSWEEASHLPKSALVLYNYFAECVQRDISRPNDFFLDHTLVLFQNKLWMVLLQKRFQMYQMVYICAKHTNLSWFFIHKSSLQQMNSSLSVKRGGNYLTISSLILWIFINSGQKSALRCQAGRSY